MAPTEVTRLFQGEQLPPTLPMSSGAIRREDSTFPIRRLRLAAVRLGRMTALQKPDGGVGGIVVGDFFRRLVSQTLKKQFGQKAEDATSPFQLALKT